MAVFQYKARSQSGEAIEGVMEAGSSELVASQLMRSGLIPVDINLAAEQFKRKLRLGKHVHEKVHSVDLIQFSRQMHSLLKAGVPILVSLAGLAGSTKNKTLRDTIKSISISLQAGRDLASALSEHPKVFNLFYISMIRIGETTGALDTIFLQLAHYLERDEKTKKQIKAAVRYPLFVISAIVIALFIINLFVIPAFASMFSKYGAQLPLATRILVFVSNSFVNYWHYMLLTLVIALAGLRYYLDTMPGRLFWGRHKLRIPIIGELIYRASLARFARLFSLATRAGVPLITSLTVVAKALDNIYLEQKILGMRAGIERGESISNTALASGMFDSLVMQMLNVGEETGSVDELLHEVALYYEQEVEYDIDRLSARIEPLLTVAIAVIILILALGVFLPMWNIAEVALKR